MTDLGRVRLELFESDGHLVSRPFEIDLPSGNYDVIFQTTENMSGVAGDNGWFVLLDSGYTSATTSIMDLGSSYSIDVFEDQVIPASRSLVVRSMDRSSAPTPVCVGFTPVPAIGTSDVEESSIDVEVTAIASTDPPAPSTTLTEEVRVEVSSTAVRREARSCYAS